MSRAFEALRTPVQFLMLLFAFSFIGLGIVLGILWYGGHLNLERLQRIGELLREDPKATPKPEPVKASSDWQGEIETARAALEAREARWREDYELMSGALRTVSQEHEKEETKLRADREALAKAQAEFEARRTAALELERSDKFKGNVRILTRLSPKNAANFVKDWSVEEIVTYVRRLRDTQAAKLLVEFDTTDPKKAKEVRELLKDQAAATAAATAPASR